MSEKASSSASSGGIGLAGLLTIMFVILKLNPGADPETGVGWATTRIANWPWFEWWGVSVFCPILWTIYCVAAIFGVIVGVAILALGIKAICERK